jgi:hypothetical protein
MLSLMVSTFPQTEQRHVAHLVRPVDGNAETVLMQVELAAIAQAAGNGEFRARQAVDVPAGPRPGEVGAGLLLPGRWCCRTGLNCGPPPYQGGALPLSYGSAAGL